MFNKSISYFKNTNLRYFYILIFFCFFSKNIFSEHYFHLDYIGAEHGLEDSSIEKIIQDTEGYIWFGTQDGLYKYDGRKAKKYSDDGREGSLVSDDIYDIIETEDNIIWVATSTGGVAIYNRITDKFRIISDKTFPRLKHYKSKVLIDQNNSVFVLGELGVERVDKETYFVSSVPVLQKNNVLTDNYSARSLVAFDGSLLTLINNKPYIYDKNLGYFSPYDFAGYEKYSYNSRSPHYSFFSSALNSLYLYTIDGVFYLDIDRKLIVKEQVPNSVKKEERLLIEDIYRDSSNTTWVISKGQGVFYRTQNKKTYSSIPIGVGKNQLNSDQVFSIFEDRTNNIWIGTDGFYAAKFVSPQSVFPFYSKFYSSNRSEHTNTIWTFEEFNDELYLGSDNGLFQILGPNNEIKPFLTIEKYRLTYDLLSTEEEMFIGGLNGLNSLLKTGETRNYNHLISKAKKNSSTTDNAVTQLSQSDSHLFIGTFNGLIAINKKSKEITYFNQENTEYKISNGAIMSLAFDNDREVLWIGSETGVDVISMANNQRISEISDIVSKIAGYINDIHIDKQGHVWIAVDSVLYRFTPENALIRYQHFPENEIRAIETVEDTLWMTTTTGMIKSSRDNLEDFVYFIQEDGLYNTGNTTMSSIYLDSTDELLFGGDKGFVRFSSSINIPIREAIAPKINQVKLMNETGQPDILDRLVSEGALEHFENSLRFEFAHLDFKAPKKTKFQYFLEGFDTAWSTLSNENIASYTNLKSGDYAFRVKVYDANHMLSAKELAIHFTIKTAKWRSDFAYFLYFISALFSVLFGINWFKTEQARIKKLQIQKNKEDFISGYNRYALSLTELQSHQTLVRKFLDQIKLITNAEYIYYKQFLKEELLEISIGKPQPTVLNQNELELTAKDSISHLIIQSESVLTLDAVNADIQMLYQQMVILQNALLDKQKYNWNDYFNSLTGLHNLNSFKNIMIDEIERAEKNSLSLVFYEWKIDKGQFKENELLKRIQLLSYGDKIKDVFGPHIIATFTEKFEGIAKFVIFLADENSEKTHKFKSEFEGLIKDIVKNNTGMYFDQQDLELVRLQSGFKLYIDTL